MKKLLLTLGTAGATLAPLATTIACGTASSFITYDATRVALVTDAGDIADKSFNEQAWNALKTINPDATETGNVNQPAGHSPAEISAGYEAMVTAGNQTILAPGFYHADAITSFNENNGVNAANFILVDSVVDASNVASITYETQDAGFMAGYLAGTYLESMNDTDPTVGTFGGGNFPGVTDFMVGFVNGVVHYNANNADAADVTFATLGTDEAYTNTGFAAGGGSAAADALVADSADVIMPVAGPQTADAIKAFDDASNTTGKVIGVDTDQALAYPADEDRFITSVLKNLEKSFVDVAKVISGETISGVNGLGKTTVGTLDNGLIGIADNNIGGTLYADAIATAIQTAAKAASADATKNTWEAALVTLKATV